MPFFSEDEALIKCASAERKQRAYAIDKLDMRVCFRDSPEKNNFQNFK